jgi:TonB-dependent SusC/RagA subfamily outer membrane receptor
LRRGFLIIAICISHSSLAEGLVFRNHPVSNIFQITGKVIDEDAHEGMPGVNVVVKGTTIGTTTDINGEFFLDVPDANSVLIFSFIGYRTQEVAITSATYINVTLRVDVIVEYRVIQMGYRPQAENQITGSVVTLDSREMTSYSPANLAQGMQGKLAGVIVGNDNSPGGESMIRIRGFGSPIDSSPLLVMDGVVVNGNLNTLNPNDIESISVLKDGAASAPYGSRGANGVVIVTTKKGNFGKPILTYDVCYGISRSRRLPKLLNTEEFAQLTWQSRINAGAVGSNGNPVHGQFGNGAVPVIPDYIFPSGVFEGDPRVAKNANGEYVNYSADIDGTDFNKTRWLITKTNKQGTNWLDEIHNGGSIQNHQLGISGGSQSGRYAVSLNYFDQQGIMNHTNFKRYSMRVTTQFNMNERVRIGETFQFAYGGRVEQPYGNNNDSNPIINAYRMQPTIPVYDVAGNFAGNRGTDLDNALNPVALLSRNQDNINKEIRLFGNTFLEIDVLKNLTAKTNLGVDYSSFNCRQYTPRDVESGEAIGSNKLQTTNYFGWMLTWYNTLHYNVSFSESHRVEFLVGTETIRNKVESFSASRTSFLVNDIDNRYLSGGGGVHTNGGSGSSWTLRSQFLKMNYEISGKYFLEATFQRERTSLIPSTDRPSLNPGFSGAWLITQEPFMERTDHWLSSAKIRGGWGKNSNQTNVGIYVLFGNGRIEISADWYTRHSKAFLLPNGYYLTYGSFVWGGNSGDGNLDSLLVPPLEPVIPTYLGEVTNEGVDLMLNYYGTAIATDLRYNVGFNFTAYRNNIAMSDPQTQFFGFNDERIQNFVVTQSGHPISSYYGYVVEGVFKSDAEASNAPINMLGTNQNRVGRFQYKDVNEDGIIDSRDATVIGSPHPDFTYGLSVQVNYRNFGLTLFGHGVSGNDIFNYIKYWTDFPTFNGNRSKRMSETSWQPNQANASLPQLTSSDQISLLPSTYYVEKGSYFRMKNIELAYSISAHTVSKAGLKGIRIFFQVQNLFTITRYSGLDPEVNLEKYTNGDQQIGVDGGVYPASKQYLVGINLKL